MIALPVLKNHGLALQSENEVAPGGDGCVLAGNAVTALPVSKNPGLGLQS